MFTCYLGKGDKETFAYAMMSVGEPYTLVETPPRAIGTTGARGPRSVNCDILKLNMSHFKVQAVTVGTVSCHMSKGKLLRAEV